MLFLPVFFATLLMCYFSSLKNAFCIAVTIRIIARSTTAIAEASPTFCAALSGIARLHIPPEHLESVLLVSVPGYKSETAVNWLAEKGICLSASSACSTKKKTNRVLADFGLCRFGERAARGNQRLHGGGGKSARRGADANENGGQKMQMKKIVLLKYGELVLKGLNRSYFDNLLLRRVRVLLKAMGGTSAMVKPPYPFYFICLNLLYSLRQFLSRIIRSARARI